MERPNKLNTLKTNHEIRLIQEKYQDNPFKHWKANLHNNEEMLIASIPFVRNLAEYVGHSEYFNSLTSLLHYKESTSSIKLADLITIFRTILVDKATLNIENEQRIVLDLIYDVADRVLISKDEVVDLENKVVLAIAIRLKAEEFMVAKINDEAFWKGINKNQTRRLIKRFTSDFPGDTENIKHLEEVCLMTPENIHLNSFMYEPILDMANEHLKQLYIEIRDNLK